MLIGPIGIPIFIWFMWFYGVEIIATIFFSIWSFIADFINSSRTVVEAYMKMRSQAPKYDFEFFEYGDFITKWT